MKRFSLAAGVVMVVSLVATGCGEKAQEPATDDNTPAAAGSTPPTAVPPAGNVEVTLTTQPDPPRTGETNFEATVVMGGEPVTDADVSVELFMPAMPEMNMAAMRNTVRLTHEGGGRYRGAGNVMMAGNWDATVSVRRDGQEVGARKIAITAK